MQKTKNGTSNLKNFTPMKSNQKKQKESLTKSIKMRTKTKPQEKIEYSMTKSFLKT